MTTNAELLERHRAVLPNWLSLYYDPPISFDYGKGRHVFDVEGNRYLDFFGGILTTSIGHDVPEGTRAIRDQASSVLPSSTLYLSEPMIELAELVADLSGIPDARVFFTTSGTEANDAALLLATTNPGKLREFRRLFPDLRLLSPADLQLQLTVAETGTTFVQNAMLTSSEVVVY